MNPEDPPIEVSVIMPAFNASATIGAQLDSLRPQAADVALEVLVCDNGSSDDTAAVALRHSDAAMRTRIVDASSRRGPSAARNIGAAQARGALLLFCDADDVVDRGWVASMVDALGSADLVAGALDGLSLNIGNRASVSWEVSSDIRMPFWTRFGAGASSNLGVRADVFAEVGGFDERLQTGEDVDFCWRVQLAGRRFGRSRDAVVQSRRRDGRRAVWRQAYAYGAGTRALQVKYREHIAAGGDRVDELVFGAAPERSVESVPRSPLARAARILTPTGQANLAWRVGEELGKRFGHVHPDVRPLPLS